MDERNLAELLGEHATRHVVPGAALGVFRGGMATLASHGVADVATAVPVTAETRFSTGSLTKPMVATVIARLARSGGLSLDDVGSFDAHGQPGVLYDMLWGPASRPELRLRGRREPWYTRRRPGHRGRRAAFV